MYKNILIASALSIVMVGNSQPPPNVVKIEISTSEDTFSINFNDTSYTRILDGVILDNKTIVNSNEFELAELSYISDSARKHSLGVISNKPLMLIRSSQFKIENELDSYLSADSTYHESSLTFPTVVKFAISINGKIVEYDKKSETLSNLTMAQIKSISFLDSRNAQIKYGNTPFGVIELKV